MREFFCQSFKIIVENRLINCHNDYEQSQTTETTRDGGVDNLTNKFSLGEILVSIAGDFLGRGTFYFTQHVRQQAIGTIESVSFDVNLSRFQTCYFFGQ